MKMILVFVLMFSSVAFADKREEKFQAVKNKLTSHLDQRIAHLQEVKSCVSAAKDHEALRICRKKNREGQIGFRSK